jgi:hypothetical protein
MMKCAIVQPMVDQTVCKICNAKTSELFDFLLLQQHLAKLRQCSNCGFEFIENPIWLADSFLSSLNQFDVGSADRSLIVAGFVRSLFSRKQASRVKVLDFGGGDGLATRTLRDSGIDCRWEDPYCQPVFAVGPDQSEIHHFDLVFMSEVALHLTDPLEMIKSLTARSDRLLMTAVVPPEKIGTDWWYLMPQTGQHVAFYPVETLRWIAKHLSLHLLTDGRFFHQFSTLRPSFLERVMFKVPQLAMLRWKLMEIGDLVRRGLGRHKGLTASDQDSLGRKVL